jgi:hypothetical protein
MNTTTKTREFEIQGLYCGGWEMVTTVSTHAEARAMLETYRREERGTIFRIRIGS